MSPTLVDESRLALHWMSGSLSMSLAYDDEFIQNDATVTSPDSVLRQHLRSQQLGLSWLVGSQWTANLNLSHNLLIAAQQSSDSNANPILLDVRENFNQVDASVNWQFNRIGSVDFGVRNATGKSFQYTESDPLMPRFSKGRMGYARVKLVW
jgi:hypothetical protein